MIVEYRPTVPDDLAALTHLTDGSPLPHRIRAITVVIDGVIMGLGGIGWRPDGMCVAFVHARPGAKAFPIVFHRAGLLAMAMIRTSGARRVFAEAQPGNPAAARWLLRLGFKRANGIFVWERDE